MYTRCLALLAWHFLLAFLPPHLVSIRLAGAAGLDDGAYLALMEIIILRLGRWESDVVAYILLACCCDERIAWTNVRLMG